MKKSLLVLMAVGLMGISACQRKDEPNKIIDPIPVNSAITCIPGQLGQTWTLLKRDGMSTIITIINKTTVLTNTFPANYTGLNNIAPNTYQFQLNERHYGTATFTIVFKDGSNNPIDPIQSISSTATIKSVDITVTGGNDITFTENLVLTLETAGLTDSDKKLTGTSTLTGRTYTLTYTIAAPGITCTFEGLTAGVGTMTGSGAGGQPTTMDITFYPDHVGNGRIAWEGLAGGIHYEDNGTGYVVTSQFRILLE